MAHKNAEQLIAETEELVSELKIYEGYKESLLKSLKALEADYNNKRLTYVQYERKLNSMLKGKTKAEGIAYYNAYEYSLLKKIEFILSQVFSIVYNDESYKKQPVKPVEQPAALPQRKEKKVHVFNIDNEILKLKDLLEKTYTAPEVEAVVKKIDVKIPELENMKQEIQEAEELASAVKKANAEKAQVEKAALARAEEVQVEKAALARAKEVPVEKEALAKAEEITKVAEVEAKKSPRIPKFNIKFPKLKAPSPRSMSLKLNLSPKEGLRELRTGYNFVKDKLKLLHFPTRAKAKLQKDKKLKPLSKARNLISFSDVVKFGEENEKPKQPKKQAPKFPKEHMSLFAKFKEKIIPKKKGIFVEEIVSMERVARKTVGEEKIATEEAGIAFGWFSPKRFLYELTRMFRKKQEPLLGLSTTVPAHVKKLREMRKRLYVKDSLSGFDSTLLAQEAKRIKRILEVEKKEVYQGSSIGLIANVTVRKITLFFVNNFPQFFGYLYNALRAANVRVLSNTYVNILVLVTLMMTLGVFFILLFVFFALNYPLYQIFLRSFIFAIVGGVLCATIFYMYPFIRIRERRRKTTVNLPFAINHMSAVATSGVPPARMFELIADSGEYDEVGVEVKKIVDFINIFGYDLLTAIRAVSATTPSLVFRKFLEGLVSTVETGGDLVSYFRQEADEAALTYKLERQRYNETVSTYSDIYTGVLIAAPLFFISAMAMINILGGTLGGLGVGTVMALGAYVVIPLLNIGFILFLQMTQPEV